MRRVRKIVCSVVIGFVVFAAAFCCCIQPAQAASIPSSQHSCCPAKADPSHSQPSIPCQHQFTKAEKASFDSYNAHYLWKAFPAYAAAERAFVVHDPSSRSSLTIDNAPPSATAIPLYLQSRNLRL